MHARARRNECVYVVDGKVEHLALAHWAPIHHREGEGRQRQGFLVDAVALRLLSPLTGLQGSEPPAHSQLLEEGSGGGEVAALAMQRLKPSRRGGGQAREAGVALEKRVMRKHGRLELGELGRGERAR